MANYKQDFIKFLVSKKALKFGDFELKSGRRSPYFFSTGVFFDGESINTLGSFYARKIREEKIHPTLLFGPAYKGIPLAVATTIVLHRDYRYNVEYVFDRKEEKTYGDKSSFVGAELAVGKKVLLIDDVITTGRTKDDVIKKITAAAPVQFVGLIIALDRMEQGENGEDVIEEFSSRNKMPVMSIITRDDIEEYIFSQESDEKLGIAKEVKDKFIAYKKRYGINRK